MIKNFIQPSIQFLFVLCSLFGQAALAENSTKEIVKASPSNLVSDRPITLDNYTGGAEMYNPTLQKVAEIDPTITNKNIEQPKQSNWYSAIDFGSNTLYVTNGRQVATTTAGVQVTAKVGYSMNGPRLELESSIGTLASGSALFNGTGVNAYYDFQTGSIRPYIGVGYGFGSLGTNQGSTAGSILQSKLGVSFESIPGNNFYVELRGIQSTESNNAGIASLNVGNTFRF